MLLTAATTTCCNLLRQQEATFSGRSSLHGLPTLSAPAWLHTPSTTTRRSRRRNLVMKAAESEEGGLKTTKEMTFTYMSQEASDELDAARADARERSLQEYDDLKNLLLKRTWRFGTFFAGYLLLTVSAESAVAELVGSAAGYGYFLWLIRDVDAYGPDSAVPLRAAEQIEPEFARSVAKLAAAYQQSLNPRLLVIIGLVAGCAAWNATFPEFNIGIVEQGCFIGGFWSYKIALILKIYDDLKPRAMSEEEMLSLSRPQLADVEDVPLNLRRPSEKIDDAEGEEKQIETKEAVAAEQQLN